MGKALFLLGFYPLVEGLRRGFARVIWPERIGIMQKLMG